MRYIKSLDSLRAFAVLLVIFDHWALVREQGKFVPKFLHPIPFGTIGVTIFFVLSGFLISGILFESRVAIQEKKITLKKALSTFFVRRTLRIFPIYYLLLLLLLLLSPNLFDFDKNSHLWLFSYLTNFYLYFREDWIGFFMPLWSLGVEEQFYLFWPIIILLINKKYILHSIIIIILVGVFSRAVFEFSPELLYRKGFYIFTTPTCLDAFGLGALLAYLNKNNLISNKIIRTIKISSWVSLIVFSLLIVFLKFPSPSQNIFYRFLISIISIQLILYFLNIHKLKVLFENNILVYIGKISYSLYLFHNFIPIFYQRINSYLIIEGYKIPFTNYSWLPYVGGNIQMILYFVILLGLSTISWFIFEKPINSLKNKFTY